MQCPIREATPGDLPAILALVAAAFGQEQGPDIARLVADLTADRAARPALSLVASAAERLAGHVLFTTVHIGECPTVSAMILAPLAVHPDFQGQGVGGELIRAGLAQARGGGVALAFVLGHPGYYSRHGFRPAGVLGLDAPHPIPPEHADAWMVTALRPGVLGLCKGVVRCAPTLNDPRHWRE